ncbi:MAG: nucleoside recognition domain-containing protein [Verrucomicrobiia bacterium]
MSEIAPIPQRLAAVLFRGLKKAVKTGAWLLVRMVPISLGVTLLQWCGVLPWLAQWIEPGFRHVGLPGETALAFLIGALMNVYSAIAAMSAIPLTDRQVTIFALMVLISHNLPIEVSVQHSAGTHGVRLLGLRLFSSALGAFLLNLFLPASTTVVTAAVISVPGAASAALGAALSAWASSVGWLVGKVLLFVLGVMLLQEFLHEFDLLHWLARLVSPILALLGLPRSVAFLWIVANTLGLAYGAGVLVPEAQSGRIRKEEIGMLNRSIAVCHSLLEDTLLFVAVGAWAFWITAPRLVVAAAAVWLFRLGLRRGWVDA